MDPDTANQGGIPQRPDAQRPIPTEQVQPEHGYTSAPIERGRGSRMPLWSWAATAIFLLLGCVVFGIFTGGLVIFERANRVFSEVGIDIRKLEEQRPLLTASQF